jgi:osmotically-inducible protein OsmY
MKRNQWVVVVSLALLIIASAACSSRGPHSEVDEAAIETNIRAQIATHYPGETFDLGVAVAPDGVVTLTGKLDDNDKRSRVEEIARNTPGVTRVVNNITVGE